MNHLKGYASVEEAARSKAGLQPDAVIEENCRACGLVHVRQPKKAAPASRLMAAHTSDINAAVRALVLARDGYMCVCCGHTIVGEHYSLGHRLRASQGGRPVPSNLLTFRGLGGELCHGRIDSRRNPEDEAKGFTVRSWQDPALIPVMIVSEHGSGISVWLDDAGSYSAEPPAVAA